MNRTGASSTPGMISQKADEARGQMRFDLRDKICLLHESDDFWGKILKTDSVPTSLVTEISTSIQNDVKALRYISDEDQMYRPLSNVFNVIESQDLGEGRTPRFWTDYHTKYPGVDPDVFVGGLEHDDEPETTHTTSFNDKSSSIMPSSKRQRTGPREFLQKGETLGGPEEDISSDDDQANDPSWSPMRRLAPIAKRKAPSEMPNLKKPVDFRKPDLILLDGDSNGKPPEKPLWRQISVILELKANPSNAPTKPKPTSSLVVQCAEYARLHLALRPFQRFSIQFSLCRTRFTAWLIDREGVLISDTVDIATPTGVQTFIRALYQVTNTLATYDLGMDPTVAIAGNGAMGDANIPRFRISMPSGNVYATIGTPVWQSSSLFGRGTTVWNVHEQLNGTESALTHDNAPFILKSAYRSPERIGESSFYQALKGLEISGLAAFKEGGDMTLLPTTEQIGMKEPRIFTPMATLTNKLHRNGLADSYKCDSIAHRLVLMSRGRRLNEYSSVLEVLNAVLESVNGHKSLYDHGILHRDISIGNVFIQADNTDTNATAGFLADLDMAKVYDPTKLSQVNGIEQAMKLVRERGSGKVTGTAQFMALPLLLKTYLLQDNQLTPNPPEARKRERKRFVQETSKATTSTSILSEWEIAARHDLESFIWVILFAFCLREMNSKQNTRAVNGRSWYLKERFLPIFGAVSFRDTHAKHLQFAAIMCSDLTQTKTSHFDEPVIWDLLGDLMQLAQDGKLDHTVFKGALEHYIKWEMEQDTHETNEASIGVTEPA
ncbi:hypothetical protein M408DRAFT_236276 [Serendipita vermifera MAFF 305830]|uniref:Fungal-type protein kinase domain-containing protein n=1 Tax=Serendipita vermifera MAFF 305830 TaxID=933852 RepID=A0A0C3B4B0_SERVB|nr:hypothetical protein M408DRAFT_236276 [Serendipita vermifera MAFF 305830]